ncbi:MAG: hypothetical protein IPK83_02745 [Planctomycetes bacterium]|nr:hypothetical protein [Planctomycetota bacterium]
MTKRSKRTTILPAISLLTVAGLLLAFAALLSEPLATAQSAAPEPAEQAGIRPKEILAEDQIAMSPWRGDKRSSPSNVQSVTASRAMAPASSLTS